MMPEEFGGSGRLEARRKTVCACDAHQLLKCKTNTGGCKY